MLTKHGGNLGASGCVAYLFEKRGVAHLRRRGRSISTRCMEAALEAGADDVVEAGELDRGGDGAGRARRACARRSRRRASRPPSASITMEPSTTVQLEGDARGDDAARGGRARGPRRRPERLRELRHLRRGDGSASRVAATMPRAATPRAQTASPDPRPRRRRAWTPTSSDSSPAQLRDRAAHARHRSRLAGHGLRRGRARRVASCATSRTASLRPPRGASLARAARRAARARSAQVIAQHAPDVRERRAGVRRGEPALGARARPGARRGARGARRRRRLPLVRVRARADQAGGRGQRRAPRSPRCSAMVQRAARARERARRRRRRRARRGDLPRARGGRSSGCARPRRAPRASRLRDAGSAAACA